MIIMNLSMKQKLAVAKRGGEGWIGSFVLADASIYILNG